MEKSSFFNSVSGDRKYSAEDWAAYFSAFISNGVYLSPTDSLQVTVNTGMSVKIKAGSAFINGYFYRNTIDITKPIAVADGVYPRIDRIVVRWSLVNRNMAVFVLTGTPASNPTAPALTRNAETYEIALADIRVNAGVTAITGANITNRRSDTNLCGQVVSALQQLDLSSFMAQFEAWMTDNQASFNQWFATLQSVLDGNTAGNLQNQLNAIKADGWVTANRMAGDAVKLTYTNKTVPVSAFVSNATYEDYPYRAAIALTGVTNTMIPEVMFGLADAVEGNFAPISETYMGGVYIYAADIPEAAITIPTIICWR